MISDPSRKHKPERIILHCSATPNNREVDIEEIRRWHTDPKPKGNGWNDVGYHCVIKRSGERQWGRSLYDQGAHVHGANVGSIGICLVGTDKFTMSQFTTLRYTLDSLRLNLDIPDWEMLRCHFEFESARKQGKTCPNLEPGRLHAWYFLNREEAIWKYISEG